MYDTRMRGFAAVAMLAMAESSVYNMVYMRGTFYNLIQSALALDHDQLGVLWSVYGTVSMISYLIGGWLADSIPAKRLLLFSMGGTAVLGLVLMLCPPYPVLLVLFAFFGVVTIMTFYPVTVKLTAAIGTELGQATVFGVASAVLATGQGLTYLISILIANRFPENPVLAYRIIILFYAAVALAMFLLFEKAFYLFDNYIRQTDWTPVSIAQMGRIILDRRVWLVGLTICSSYIAFSGCTYLAPYMTECLGMTESTALWINLLRGTLLCIPFAAGTGILSDRIGSPSRLIAIYALISAAILLGLALLPECTGLLPLSVGLIICVSLLTYGLRSIAMSCAPQSGLTLRYLGCASGMICFIGYSPDAFYYGIAGKILTVFPEQGHNILMISSAFFLLFCAALCMQISRQSKACARGQRKNEPLL